MTSGSGRSDRAPRSGGSGRTQTIDLERYRSFVPDWDAFTACASRPEPTVFRVRTGRTSEASVLERLHEQGFRTRALDGMPGFHQVEAEPHPVTLTFEHWNGLIYVQQASTGVAAPALDPHPGERVLDMCSAPGGKTAHAAELMGDTGCLVASEISENRIRGLLGNMYRLGHTNVLAVAGDGRDFPAGASFDRVLVDAPCTGEGTLRRRGGRPPRQSRSFLGYVTSAQHALLTRAIELTRPGGVILYVTCTFAPEENEAVVSRVLSELPVDLEPLDLPVPHAPGLTSFEGQRFDARLEGAARIYPHHLDSGGLFLAKLRKPGAPAGAGAVSESASGWSPVPAAFPADDGEEPPPDGADELVARATEDLADRFGVASDVLDGFSWTVRGGRVWMHSVDSWPLASWAPGGWRPISIGIRAVEFDTKGRARPTNDVLRLLSGAITERRIDLDAEACLAFLRREPVPCPQLDVRGPVAVSCRGDVIGRGALTEEGLKTEVPKARASDLRRVMGAGEG